MEEEKSILDTVFKTCACCGQKRTLRNYRLPTCSEFGNNIVYIGDTFANVCKCCEKHPEMQLKSNRLAMLREKMEKYRVNEFNRHKKEKEKALENERL